MKKLPADFKYLEDMYNDAYYPKHLVDKIKVECEKVVHFIEQGNHSLEEIQQRFDTMAIAINDLGEEFYENDSELETVARESIGQTVSRYSCLL